MLSSVRSAVVPTVGFRVPYKRTYLLTYLLITSQAMIHSTADNVSYET